MRQSVGQAAQKRPILSLGCTSGTSRPHCPMYDCRHQRVRRYALTLALYRDRCHAVSATSRHRKYGSATYPARIPGSGLLSQSPQFYATPYASALIRGARYVLSLRSTHHIPSCAAYLLALLTTPLGRQRRTSRAPAAPSPAASSPCGTRHTAPDGCRRGLHRR